LSAVFGSYGSTRRRCYSSSHCAASSAGADVRSDRGSGRSVILGGGGVTGIAATLNHYAAKREDLLAIAKDLFDVVGSGAVKIDVAGSYPLKDARKAHEDLEGRKTTGSLILIP